MRRIESLEERAERHMTRCRRIASIDMVLNAWPERVYREGAWYYFVTSLAPYRLFRMHRETHHLEWLADLPNDITGGSYRAYRGLAKCGKYLILTPDVAKTFLLYDMERGTFESLQLPVEKESNVCCFRFIEDEARFAFALLGYQAFVTIDKADPHRLAYHPVGGAKQWSQMMVRVGRHVFVPCLSELSVLDVSLDDFSFVKHPLDLPLEERGIDVLCDTGDAFVFVTGGRHIGTCRKDFSQPQLTAPLPKELFWCGIRWSDPERPGASTPEIGEGPLASLTTIQELFHGTVYLDGKVYFLPGQVCDILAYDVASHEARRIPLLDGEARRIKNRVISDCAFLDVEEADGRVLLLSTQLRVFFEIDLRQGTLQWFHYQLGSEAARAGLRKCICMPIQQDILSQEGGMDLLLQLIDLFPPTPQRSSSAGQAIWEAVRGGDI